MLTATVLGGFGLLDANGRNVAPRSRKACCMLGYLLLSGLGSARRDRLAGLLWSERSDAQAYDSLRHCIAELRQIERISGIKFVLADRQTLGIDRAHLKLDLDELKTSLAAADVGACRHLLGRPDMSLMAGYECGDQTFDNWLLVERERCAETLVHDMLAILGSGRLSARDRVDLADTIVQLNPFQEDAIRVHMDFLGNEGKLSAAADYFERYRQRLLREYEVEPSDELLEFAEALPARFAPNASASVEQTSGKGISTPVDSASSSASVRLAATARERAPTIAVVSPPVLPSAGPTQSMAEAFQHELVSMLCRFKEWTIVARGKIPAVLDMDGVADVLSELARCGIDYALLPTFSQVAGTTVINIRLTECHTRSVLLSDQYPAETENWFVVLNDVCCRIAFRTEVGLTAARLRKSAERSPERCAAYDLWLEGEVLSWVWGRETEDRAVELFKRALELDSGLASAYGGWAAVLNSRWFVYPGLTSDEADREQAYELAKRAIALDPLNSRNHVNLGWSHVLARRFEPGELQFELAYELNPSNPNIVLACALAFAFCGKHERAQALCRRAFELNPLRPSTHYGYRASVEFLGRNFAGCIEAVKQAPDLFPDIQGWAAAAHTHLGQREEAEAAFAQFLADVRKHWAGPPNPSDQDLISWIVGIFPIRRDIDRSLLADGLVPLLAGRKESCAARPDAAQRSPVGQQAGTGHSGLATPKHVLAKPEVQGAAGEL